MRHLFTCGLLLACNALRAQVVLPEGKAKKTIENACAECHGLDQVVAATMSEKDWRGTVNRMVKKGATLSPAEIDLVVDYLAVYFAPDKIDINKATAKDMVTVLSLTAQEADAIVKYREGNGAFKDLAGLQKVSGVDSKKLDDKKDLIAF